MRTRLVSLAWAILGGFTAFVLGCWLGAMLVTAIVSYFGKNVTMTQLNDVCGMGILLGLWAGYRCHRLFLSGKLPDFGGRNPLR